ncbi:hypothetical protein FB446DRAFT_794046 [Lentinula raphanica]|nr:hypothetical protein FB446DRAFT_794046 [Lentinula raphanica]
MSRVSSTPLAPVSEDLPLLYTVRIILRLRALRASLELSGCPPRPPLDADENFLGLSIYPGSMTEPTSQDDLNFGSLGRLFFIIEQRLDGDAVRKRAVFDDGRIPRRILESDPELNELLLLRNTSILRSTAVVADAETDRSVCSSNDSQVDVATADAENEVSGPRSPSRHSQLNVRAESKHAPYYIPNRIDRLLPRRDACQMPKGITVIILAWTKDSYRQITANLNIGNGHCMTLSMVTTTTLADLFEGDADLFEGDVDSSNLERYKPGEIDFRLLPNLTMPKVTSTSKSASPSAHASALKQEHTKKIVARLIAIQTSRSMTMFPPKPMINPAHESIVRKGIFNGSTHEVNSPLHPDFRKLGTIFWVVEKNIPPAVTNAEENGFPAEQDVEAKGPPARKSIVYDTASIPIEVLLADRALMRYLELRGSVRTLGRGSRGSATPNSSLPSSPARRRTASVSSTPVRRTNAAIPSTPSHRTSAAGTPSASTFPVTPDLSRVLVPLTPGTASPNVAAGRLAPTDSARQANDDDDEVEFVGFVHPDGAILPDRPVRQVKHNNSSGKANTTPGSNLVNPTPSIVILSITVHIVVWAAENFKHQAVHLPLASGQYMRLSMVSKVLRRLGLDIEGELDRFIRGGRQLKL